VKLRSTLPGTVAFALALSFCCPASAQTEPVSTQAPTDTTPQEQTGTPAPENTAATPPEDPVEADAQAYTRLVVRHDSLLFREEMRQITPAEQSEMAGIPARGAEIARKYAPGEAMNAQAAAYQQRVKELSETVVAAARRDWITQAFPSAAAIIAAYSTDAERLASLQLLLDLLEYRVIPAPPPTVEKKNSYRREIARISPPAKFDATLFAATRRLGQSKQFRLDVLNKFVPAYAADAARVLEEEQVQTEISGNLFMFWAALGGTLFAVLAAPLVFLVRGQHAHVEAGYLNPNEAFQLPPALTDATLFRRTCGLSFDCGRIRFRDGEIHTFETPDGRAMKMLMEVVGLDPGDIVSVVARGSDTLIYYSHSRGERFVSPSTMHQLIVLPVDLLFWFSYGLLSASFAAIFYFVYPLVKEVNPLLSAALGAWGVFMFLVLYYYIGFMHVFVKKIRTRQLYKWIPTLEAFIAERAPLVRQSCATRGDALRKRK